MTHKDRAAVAVPGRDQLLAARHASAYRQQMMACVERVQHRLENVARPFDGVRPQELAPTFADIDLDEHLGALEPTLNELERVYLDHAVYFHHPRYVAHLNCPLVMPGVLAEAILAPINSSLDTFDQSAGGTFIEQALIDWTAKRLGLGERADGIFTSGGTQSNLMALMLARDHHGARLDDHGGNKLCGLPTEAHRYRILGSEVSHFSLKKSAAILGLGYQAVMPVACDEDFRMNPAALSARLAECRDQGLIPIAVVATAGTTDFGSIDPLPQIGRIARAHGCWFHVDAAYGGGLITSKRHAHRLIGTELADSVTIDYHKTFFQPVSCSAFLVNEADHLGHVTHYADYLNPEHQARAGTPDQVNKSLQTTRRFDALKLWLTLRLMGADALGELFDQVIALAQAAYRRMAERAEFEVLLDPPLSTLVFRYRPDIAANEPALDEDTLEAMNRHIRAALSRDGEAVIAATKVAGRHYLKFTLLNPDTRLEDIEAILARIRHHGDAWRARQPGGAAQAATASAPKAAVALP